MRTALWALSGAALVLSCQPRKFNTGKTSDVDNPDGGAQPCPHTLAANVPYTPEVFGAEFAKAVREAARDASNHDALASFLFRSQISTAARGNVGEIASMFTGESACGTTREINKSRTRPAQAMTLSFTGRDSYGGVVMYRGDVFAEGFYRTRAVNPPTQEDFRREAIDSVQGFKNRQPWFEWNGRTFVFHKNGAENRLLAHTLSENTVNGKYRFYRGTKAKYTTPQSIYDSPGGNLSGFGNVRSQFTTPHREVAVRWASPAVVSFEASVADIKQAVESSSNPLAYVGIEYDYVEIALFVKPEEPVSKRIIDSVRPLCVKDDEANTAEARALGVPMCSTLPPADGKCTSAPNHGRGPYQYVLTSENAIRVFGNGGNEVANLAAVAKNGVPMVLGGENIKVYFDARSGTGNGLYIYTNPAGAVFLNHDNVAGKIPMNCVAGAL